MFVVISKRGMVAHGYQALVAFRSRLKCLLIPRHHKYIGAKTCLRRHNAGTGKTMNSQGKYIHSTPLRYDCDLSQCTFFHAPLLAVATLPDRHGIFVQINFASSRTAQAHLILLRAFSLCRVLSGTGGRVVHIHSLHTIATHFQNFINQRARYTKKAINGNG